jgi:cytochrome c
MRVTWAGLPAVAVVALVCGRALAEEAPALADRSGCRECHGEGKRVPGPTYHDIAERYRGNPGARAQLIETVKRGGKGHWTAQAAGAPMPPYGRRLSKAEIQSLVDWILGQP